MGTGTRGRHRRESNRGSGACQWGYRWRLSPVSTDTNFLLYSVPFIDSALLGDDGALGEGDPTGGREGMGSPLNTSGIPLEPPKN